MPAFLLHTAGEADITKTTTASAAAVHAATNSIK